MWNIKPEKMCRKHLLGEHVECHMFVGCINKKMNLKGYIDNGLLEIHNLKLRHERIKSEMLKRGYEHNSPLPGFKNLKKGKINIKENIKELKRRCVHCRGIINKK